MKVNPGAMDLDLSKPRISKQINSRRGIMFYSIVSFWPSASTVSLGCRLFNCRLPSTQKVLSLISALQSKNKQTERTHLLSGFYVAGFFFFFFKTIRALEVKKARFHVLPSTPLQTWNLRSLLTSCEVTELQMLLPGGLMRCISWGWNWMPCL